MTGPLFTAERAEAAFMRHWLRHDALHAALAVCHRCFTPEDALHSLKASACFRADRAKMSRKLARTVATAMFRETLEAQEARLAKVQWSIVDAVRSSLAEDPDNIAAATTAAAAIARANQAPPGMISTGFAIAARGR